VTGLAFARLTSWDRHRPRPVRALIVSGLWFLAAFATHVIDTWAGSAPNVGWLFPGLQLLVFLVAFSVAWDAYDHWQGSAGDTWQRLKELYPLQPVQAGLAWGLPVVGAVLALGQQVSSGTAADFIVSTLQTAAAVVGGR
jgi:hypothetical protein